MKVLKPDELPGLPREVRALISDGMYSLYELPTSEPHYLLLTSQRTEFYFLSSHGDLMPPSTPVSSVADLLLITPVTVTDERGGVRINIGFGAPGTPSPRVAGVELAANCYSGAFQKYSAVAS